MDNNIRSLTLLMLLERAVALHGLMNYVLEYTPSVLNY